jgi:hypothetical protein
MLSVVIVRQRVRPSAGPMTGSGGRSSKHRRSDLARALPPQLRYKKGNFRIGEVLSFRLQN